MRKEVKVVMKSFKKETKNLTKKTTDNINFEVSKGFLKRNKEERQKFVNEMKTYIDTKVEVYNESLEEIFLNYNNELDEIGLTIMETKEVERQVLGPIHKYWAKLNKSLARYNSSLTVHEL